jgi:hypothetical protein
MSQSFISTCNVCSKKIHTKLDQKNNKNFTCSKKCNRLRKKNITRSDLKLYEHTINNFKDTSVFHIEQKFIPITTEMVVSFIQRHKEWYGQRNGNITASESDASLFIRTTYCKLCNNLMSPLDCNRYNICITCLNRKFK